MTRSGNGIGNKEGDQRLSSTPKACFLSGVKRAGSIIHAEGVRVGVPSSAAKAHGGLLIVGDPFEFAAYVLEVFRADAQGEHFLNHGKEVRQ